MSDLEYFAKQYASYGLAVLPLKPDKSPYIAHGFENATTNEETIERWWKQWPAANIGIATGSRSMGIFVVDQDEKKDQHGIQNFEKWIDDNYLMFSDTWTVRTPSGGKHTYFRSTMPVRGRVGWLPGVDIRGENNYVVAPPSVSEVGSYEWINSPNEIYQPISPDEDADVETLIQDINAKPSDGVPLTVPETIIQGGRNDMLYKLACSLQAKGVSDVAILSAIQAENEAKCDPPLPDDEVEKLVKSALTKTKGTAVTATTKSTKPEESKFDFPIMEPLSAKELMEMEIPEPVRFVGIDAEVPLLSEGSCVLASKAKTGKSWFCTNLCWALTTGTDFLGFKCKKCKVQYYDLEQNESIEQNRLSKVAKTLEQSIPDGFFIRTKLQRLEHGLEEQLEHDLERNPDIGVFIIDVFEMVRTIKRQTDSDYSYTYRDFSIINEIAKKNHVAIILLFHTRKQADPTDPFSDILGSTAIQGASNQMIVIMKDKYNSRNTRLVAKGRTMDGIVELEYVLENGVIRTAAPEKSVDDEDLEEFMSSEIREAVVRYMETTKSWKGKCTGLIMECARVGIGLDASPLSIGKFLGKNRGRFMKHDGILVDVINNGTGGKTYELSKPTVDTVANVDEWMPTVDENPFEGA